MNIKEGLKQDTVVDFSYQNINGTGKIVGVSSMLPILNYIYIIQTENIISEEYPYNTFVCPSCYVNPKTN